MTLSRRFAPILIVLLLIASGLVFRSAGEGKQFDPCRNPDELKRVGLLPGTVKAYEFPQAYTSRRRQYSWGFSGTGDYQDPKIAFRMVRDFGTLKLWLQPTSVLESPFVPDAKALEWLDTDAGRLPVHMEYKYTGSRPRVVAYAYVYANEPVVNPLAAALEGSVAAVVDGARPLTMLLATGRIEHGRLAILQAATLSWVAASFERYREVCGP